MTQKETFLENIDEINRTTNLTDAQLAEIMGISPVTMSKIRNVKKYPDYMPSLSAVIKLCRYFGCSADFLLGLDTSTPGTPSEDENTDINLRKFCKTIADLTEIGACRFVPVTVDESVKEYPNGKLRESRNGYRAICFPIYIFEPENAGDLSLYEARGNSSICADELNRFFGELQRATDFIREPEDYEIIRHFIKESLSRIPDSVPLKDYPCPVPPDMRGSVIDEQNQQHAAFIAALTGTNAPDESET